MTICIAALAENSTKLILAADQMITANIPIAVEYETDDVPKIHEINDNGVALAAGNALFAYEIIQNSIKKIINKKAEEIEQLAEIVRTEYQDYRRNHVIRTFFEPRGLSIDTYYNLQNRLTPGLIGELDKQLGSLNIKVDLIIAGYDSSGCHIFHISHPGNKISIDTIGYVCIGSGGPHALYYLIDTDYNKKMSVKEVEKLVSEAKKRSEKSPGVGKGTTIIQLPRNNQTEGESDGKQ